MKLKELLAEWIKYYIDNDAQIDIYETHNIDNSENDINQLDNAETE